IIYVYYEQEESVNEGLDPKTQCAIEEIRAALRIRSRIYHQRLLHVQQSALYLRAYSAHHDHLVRAS
ncbi:MAG: hypothetical protein KOO61_03525, partial [Spirochaetales bacterium]|nr:hypothetical protein [Spirochaetales bacterium]